MLHEKNTQIEFSLEIVLAALHVICYECLEIVISLLQAKPLSVLPGSGMAIEIHVCSRDKVSKHLSVNITTGQCIGS